MKYETYIYKQPKQTEQSIGYQRRRGREGKLVKMVYRDGDRRKSKFWCEYGVVDTKSKHNVVHMKLINAKDQRYFS